MRSPVSFDADLAALARGAAVSKRDSLGSAMTGFYAANEWVLFFIVPGY